MDFVCLSVICGGDMTWEKCLQFVTILDNLDIFIYNFYQIVFRIFTVLTMLNQLTSLHIFIYFGVYSCIEETVINIVVFSISSDCRPRRYILCFFPTISDCSKTFLMCRAAFTITSSTSWRMRSRSSLYWHSTDFYWLFTGFLLTSTNFSWLSTDFYWLSTGSLLTLLALYWHSTDFYWLLRISTGFLLNSISQMTLYWLPTDTLYWLSSDFNWTSTSPT